MIHFAKWYICQVVYLINWRIWSSDGFGRVIHLAKWWIWPSDAFAKMMNLTKWRSWPNDEFDQVTNLAKWWIWPTDEFGQMITLTKWRIWNELPKFRIGEVMWSSDGSVAKWRVLYGYSIAYFEINSNSSDIKNQMSIFAGELGKEGGWQNNDCSAEMRPERAAQISPSEIWTKIWTNIYRLPVSGFRLKFSRFFVTAYYVENASPVKSYKNWWPL